jgi:hypothetical protein
MSASDAFCVGAGAFPFFELDGVELELAVDGVDGAGAVLAAGALAAGAAVELVSFDFFERFFFPVAEVSVAVAVA